jgi:hypothetical protein
MVSLSVEHDCSVRLAVPVGIRQRASRIARTFLA